MLSMQWCISKFIGTDRDVKYGANNDIWIGIYDKPYYNKRVHTRCDCFGGMCTYKFDKFYQEKDIENELDLKITGRVVGNSKLFD